MPPPHDQLHQPGYQWGTRMQSDAARVCYPCHQAASPPKVRRHPKLETCMLRTFSCQLFHQGCEGWKQLEAGCLCEHALREADQTQGVTRMSWSNGSPRDRLPKTAGAHVAAPRCMANDAESRLTWTPAHHMVLQASIHTFMIQQRIIIRAICHKYNISVI